jgi:hypothetical protein
MIYARIYENGLIGKYHYLLDLSLKVECFSENRVDHKWGLIGNKKKTV